MRRLGPLLGLALCACGASDVVLGPPPSPEGGARATLYLVERDGRPAQLFAAEADTARPFSLGLGDAGRARVIALGYERGLAALGLTPGEVELVSSTRCRSRPLPDGAVLHALTVTDGVPGSWQMQDVLPVTAQDVRIDGPCPCRGFTRTQTVDVPRPALGYLGDPARDRLLVLHEDGGLSAIDAEGGLEAVETATLTPVAGLSAIARAPDGTTWLAYTDGGLSRGRLGEAFEPTAQVGNSDFIRYLLVGPGPDGNELYGVTEVGHVLGLEPGPPRGLASPRAVAEVSFQRARALWLGPGEIIAAPPTRLELIWVTDGVEAGRAELPSSSGGARFIEEVPGLGVVVLSHDARVLELEGRSVRAREDAPELSTPTGMLVFDGGYLYTGEGGYVQEYQVGYGFCPTQHLDARPRVLGFAFVGDRLAFVTYEPGGAGLQVVLYALGPLEP